VSKCINEREIMRSAFPSRSSRSTVTVVLTAFLTLFFAFSFALVTSVISAAPAAAHAALVKVTPTANGRLNSAPTEVVLDFNEPMNSKFATVVVTSAAGVSVAQGKPVVLDSKVTQALSSNLAPGGYRVAFRGDQRRRPPGHRAVDVHAHTGPWKRTPKGICCCRGNAWCTRRGLALGRGPERESR